jgi:hypothetical protein
VPFSKATLLSPFSWLKEFQFYKESYLIFSIDLPKKTPKIKEEYAQRD